MLANRSTWALVALACATFVWGGPRRVSADLIPSAPETRPQSANTAPAASARQAVAVRLAAVGVGAEDVDARLAQMSETDLQALAAAPEQLQVAGEDSTLTVIIAFVSVILLIGLLWYFVGRSDGDDDDHESGGAIVPGEPEPPFFGGEKLPF